jgi:hypothetical protein
MTFTRDGINKMHLRQLEHLARQLDARETKVKSMATRRKWVERANNANYRNEHDRILGELAHFRGPTTDKKKLDDRVAHLKSLFSSGNV